MDEELYSKLMDAALQLLSRRTYTVHQISERLMARLKKWRKSDQTDVIDKVIERLIELKYLDDQRFCEQWVEERSRLRPRGKYLLSQELRRKGIEKELLEGFWESEKGTTFDELPLALELIERKLPRLKKYENWELKQRLYRFLASRGFSLNVIREALDKALKPY